MCQWIVQQGEPDNRLPTPSHRKADIQAVTAFLQQHPDRLWHGNKLRTAIKENCEGISNNRIRSVWDTLRKAGNLAIVRGEVDGEMLNAAYQFTP